MSAAIRRAVAGDGDRLHALIERAYRGDAARQGWTHEADLIAGARIDRAELDAIVADPAGAMLVAVDGDALVGCVQVGHPRAATGYLGLLAVDPARQAGALGRQLIDAAEAHARGAYGAAAMELTVIAGRGELIGYYERRGYVRTGEVRPFPVATTPPLTLVVMAKRLHDQAGRETVSPPLVVPASIQGARRMAEKSKDEIKRDMWDKMAASPFLMVALEGGQHSEPMTAQLDKDQVDTLFFFAGKDNRIARGGPAMAQFVSKGHDFFACLAGTFSQDNDPAMIDKLWNKQVEAWFPAGKSDPNLALMRLDIDSAELWETDISITGRVKMLFGGTIKADESSSHAKVETTAG